MIEIKDLAVLTPTGARPEAFAACARFMAAQTWGGRVFWIVVDDGPERTPMPAPGDLPENWRLLRFRPPAPLLWRPGQNTQARNMALALELSLDLPAVIVEDDDAYAEDWLATCAHWLRSHDLVGEAQSLYVDRVSGTRRPMGNRLHASLCSTALRGSAKALLARICREQTSGLDIRLWREFEGSARLYPPAPRRVTGIKNWPGRPGIGAGHRLQ